MVVFLSFIEKETYQDELNAEQVEHLHENLQISTWMKALAALQHESV